MSAQKPTKGEIVEATLSFTTTHLPSNGSQKVLMTDENFLPLGLLDALKINFKSGTGTTITVWVLDKELADDADLGNNVVMKISSHAQGQAVYQAPGGPVPVASKTSGKIGVKVQVTGGNAAVDVVVVGRGA